MLAAATRRLAAAIAWVATCTDSAAMGRERDARARRSPDSKFLSVKLTACCLRRSRPRHAGLLSHLVLQRDSAVCGRHANRIGFTECPTAKPLARSEPARARRLVDRLAPPPHNDRPGGHTHGSHP